jgi:hypothetical protein
MAMALIALAVLDIWRSFAKRIEKMRVCGAT